MITYHKRTKKDDQLKNIPDFEIGAWVNVIDPTADEIEFLITKFNLDRHNIMAGLDDNEIPRVDFEDNETYIFVKSVCHNTLKTFQIIIGKEFILTLCKEKTDFLDKILTNNADILTTQKLNALIKMFTLNNKRFEAVTQDAIKEVKKIKVLTDELKEKDVAVLVEKEDLLNDLISAYYNTSIVYARLVKKLEFFEADKDILEDLMIESEEGLNLCKQNLKTISNMREYKIILISNKLNRIITILTIFTILLSIPAAISGIFGMNVLLPLQENNHAFYYVLFLIVVLWILFLSYIKKNKIL